jgi:YidC/Oxa1 family membrane protein insertase
MRQNVLNLLLFVGLAVGLYLLWSTMEQNAAKKKAEQEAARKAEQDEKQKAEEARKAEAEAKRKADERAREEKTLPAAAAAGQFAAAGWEAQKRAEKAAADERLRKARERDAEEQVLAAAAATGFPALQVPAAAPRPTLVALGDETFYNRILLNTQGGGVQQVILTRFQEADRLGRPEPGAPLFLIPGTPIVRPYYLHEPVPLPDLKPGRVPSDTALAEPSYTIFHYPTPDDKYPDPKLGDMLWTVAEEHRTPEEHRVVFEAQLGAPYLVKFRKTYTLKPKDYHIGFVLEIERLPGGQKGQGQLRYQLSGPHGLPIEGEWYTTTHRIALIGWKDGKGAARRQYETAAEVGAKRGGEAVEGNNTNFKYMAVATQYFASAVAIDNTAEGQGQNIWVRARATTELPFRQEQDRNHPQFDDVTVRAASEKIDLAPGEKVRHSYVIYNGPSKVKLLALMEGDRAVDEALVDRYADDLGLKTITDYHSPTWLGSFANAIYWSDLVITFTNLMHWLLSAIHTVVPSWALCIVVLTGIVRMILLYPSKKQTQMNMKMIEVQKKLAPQLEELKKKYGDNFHEYNRAKMQLMMAHGVSPFAAMAGCLLLLFQMPVMMGLYFCLQESVFFRLEPFLWINNLAAPDMTWYWGEKIPYISTPDNIGSFTYLGPYLNVLPIIAVVLMFGQQLAMMPPPTDEQSRQQRTMMKVMMVIMPFLFYKFASGLALYFIIGSIWGFAERKLIPKPTLKEAGGEGGGGGGGGGPEPDAGPPKPKGLLGRLREALQKRMEEMQRQADEQAKRQIRNQPERGGQPPAQGGGGGGGGGPPRRDDRRDKKKKRRK